MILYKCLYNISNCSISSRKPSLKCSCILLNKLFWRIRIISTVTCLATSKSDPAHYSCSHMKPNLVLCNAIMWCIYRFQDTGIIQIRVVQVCSDWSTKKQTKVIRHDSLTCASVLSIIWCGTCLFKSRYVVCKLIVLIVSHNAHATNTCVTHMTNICHELWKMIMWKLRCICQQWLLQKQPMSG